MIGADRYGGSRLIAFMPFPNQASPTNPWTRQRAGFRFSKEPLELAFEELGCDRMERLEALLAIAGDRMLRVVLVQGDGPKVVLNDGEGFPDRGALDLISADLAAVRLASSESVSNAA